MVPASTRPPSGRPADSRVDASLASARSLSATTALPIPPGEGMPWPASWNLIAPPVAWASCGPADHALKRTPSAFDNSAPDRWTCERCGEVREAPPKPNAHGMRGYCFICDGRMGTREDARRHYRLYITSMFVKSVPHVLEMLFGGANGTHPDRGRLGRATAKRSLPAVAPQ